jgi:hypothetical protein
MKKNKIKENGLYAIYCNKEYELIIRENTYILFSTDDEDFINNGFTYYEDASGNIDKEMFIKKVNSEEIDEVYKVRMYGVYKGHEFFIMRENNGEVLITISSPREVEIAKNLGFKFVEPFVYDKKVLIEELDEIIEKQEKVYLD